MGDHKGRPYSSPAASDPELTRQRNRAFAPENFTLDLRGGLPSAASPIGGTVAAVRAVPRGLIGVIAWVGSVRIRDSHVTVILGSRVVIATPEIRPATITAYSHDNI